MNAVACTSNASVRNGTCDGHFTGPVFKHSWRQRRGPEQSAAPIQHRLFQDGIDTYPEDAYRTQPDSSRQPSTRKTAATSHVTMRVQRAMLNACAHAHVWLLNKNAHPHASSCVTLQPHPPGRPSPTKRAAKTAGTTQGTLEIQFGR
jgi:hypothetical protein